MERESVKNKVKQLFFPIFGQDGPSFYFAFLFLLSPNRTGILKPQTCEDISERALDLVQAGKERSVEVTCVEQRRVRMSKAAASGKGDSRTWWGWSQVRISTWLSRAGICRSF